LCVESLIRLRWEDPPVAALPATQSLVAAALQCAVELAQVVGDDVNGARWASELQALAPRAAPVPGAAPAPGAADTPWLRWHTAACRPAVARHPWIMSPAAEGISLAGDAVWSGCGLHWRAGELWVEAVWPAAWSWWALLSLPLIGDKTLSLLWDGQRLHATQPVRSTVPVQVCKRIQMRHVDEYDFDPIFELTIDSDSGDTAAKHRYKPVFRFQ
jgi:hypothetical protein